MRGRVRADGESAIGASAASAVHSSHDCGDEGRSMKNNKKKTKREKKKRKSSKKKKSVIYFCPTETHMDYTYKYIETSLIIRFVILIFIIRIRLQKTTIH